MSKVFLNTIIAASTLCLSAAAFAGPNISRLGSLLESSETVGECKVTVTKEDYVFGTGKGQLTLPLLSIKVEREGFNTTQARILEEPEAVIQLRYNSLLKKSVPMEVFKAQIFGGDERVRMLVLEHDGSGNIVTISAVSYQGPFDDGTPKRTYTEDLCSPKKNN